MNMEMKIKQQSIRFKLASSTLDVDQNMLEEIKVAMISFFLKPEPKLETKYFGLRNDIINDLESSACFVSDNSARIGVWRLENRDCQLFLIRYDPDAFEKQMSINYLAGLALYFGQWEVTSFGDERAFGPE